MQKTIAAEQMYQYYKANKANLPGNISKQREFIIDAICQGQNIVAIFAVAAQNAESAAMQTSPKSKKRKR